MRGVLFGVVSYLYSIEAAITRCKIYSCRSGTSSSPSGWWKRVFHTRTSIVGRAAMSAGSTSGDSLASKSSATISAVARSFTIRPHTGAGEVQIGPVAIRRKTLL